MSILNEWAGVEQRNHKHPFTPRQKNPLSQEQWREKLKKDTEAFLARGGVVQCIPPEESKANRDLAKGFNWQTRKNEFKYSEAKP